MSQLYSLSHTATIKWALEQEYNRERVLKRNDEHILQFLQSRIKQLKEEETLWHDINAKGLSEKDTRN